jgi:hypothetical protein
MALASLLRQEALGSTAGSTGVTGLHFAPRAKRVIYLFQSGAPSHIDLFDDKPKLREMTGVDLPDSVRMGQRITGMTSGQKNLFCVGSPFQFARHGACGMSCPTSCTRRRSPRNCLLRAVHTDRSTTIRR